MSVNNLRVSLNFDQKNIPVGRLAFSNRQIFFEYDADFLKNPLPLSPFQLPVSPGVKQCDDRMFEGLHGVFNDSLPDGWGRLLLDRQLRASGISPATLTSLDRLAYVGQHGMGALCYQPEHTSASLDNDIALDRLAQESQQVLASETGLFFEELLLLNGSSGGARPKILARVSADKKQLQADFHKPSPGFSHWLIKFSSQSDPKDIGAIEFAYNQMAQAAGVDVAEAHLFTTPKHAYFGTRRFDRTDDHQRLHLHSLCGLIHADHRIPSLDYETVLKVTQALTKDITEVKKAFRLAVFNVLTHNRDDHSKNFSFLMSATGQWRLAPAYDLLFSDGPGGEQSTTVMGEGKHPAVEHLLQLAKKFALTDAKDIIATVQAAITQWPIFAKNSGVSKSSLQHIQKVILPF